MLSGPAQDVLAAHSEWVRRCASNNLRAYAAELARKGVPDEEANALLKTYQHELLADAKDRIATAYLRLAEPAGERD